MQGRPGIHRRHYLKAKEGRDGGVREWVRREKEEQEEKQRKKRRK